MEASALLFTGVNQVALVAQEVPAPGVGQVGIRVEYTCISPGTELRCLRGEQPNLDFPFIPGYSFVGIVDAVHPGSEAWLGTRVLGMGSEESSLPRGWGGHVSYAIKSTAMLTVVPEDLSPVEATVGILAGISYRGVRAGNPKPHERVAVIGLGPIGLLSALLMNTTGAEVHAIDARADRRERAAALGLATLAPEETPEDAYHVVVDATGNPRVLPFSIDRGARPGWQDDYTPRARLVVQGSYPEDVAVPYHPAFYREMAIHFPRNVTMADQAAVLSLAQRGRLPLGALVSEIARPTDCQSVYDRLRGGDDLLTVAFDWRS